MNESTQSEALRPKSGTLGEEEQKEIDRQIRLAELQLKRSSGRTLEEVVVTAKGRFDDDPEKVVQSLLDQKVFEKTADCPNPREVASALVERYLHNK